MKSLSLRFTLILSMIPKPDIVKLDSDSLKFYFSLNSSFFSVSFVHCCY